MFDISVPVLIHFLKSTSAWLKKAEEHCAARKIEPDALLKARLYPDMFHFTKQVQLVTDFAKGMGARLAGVEVPSFADTEQTFAELQARISKTIDFLSSLKKESFAGAESRIITLKIGGEELKVPGAMYLMRIGMPNFHFHMTTAYDILRHNGVELGKGDYVGRNIT